MYCLSNEKEWDQGNPFLLLAVRDAKQESLGFSPFELVYGHIVRGPLKLLKDVWLLREENQSELLDYVTKFKERLVQTWKLAREKEDKIKTW
jgi:hypothetical protein